MTSNLDDSVTHLEIAIVWPWTVISWKFLFRSSVKLADFFFLGKIEGLAFLLQLTHDQTFVRFFDVVFSLIRFAG